MKPPQPRWIALALAATAACSHPAGGAPQPSPQPAATNGGEQTAIVQARAEYEAKFARRKQEEATPAAETKPAEAPVAGETGAAASSTVPQEVTANSPA